jgi:hypothetical protein
MDRNTDTENTMRDFFRNLLLLTLLGLIIYFIAPDMVRQIVGIYGGLGILPIVIILVVLAALPRKRRKTRR